MKDTILSFLKTWKPTSDRVLVLPQAQARETDSGILTSDTKQGNDKRVIGEVIAVGPGRYSEDGHRIPMEFYVGDKVIFGKYAGEDLLVSEDLRIDKYEGVKREDEVLVTIVRSDSLLTIL